MKGDIDMLIVWIIAVIAFIIAVNYTVQILKRLALYQQMSTICRSNGFSMSVKHGVKSVFTKSGGADIEIKAGSKTYQVYIFTTIFKRIRYHINLDSVELIRGRRMMYMTNIRRPSPSASQTLVTTLMKLKNFKFEDTLSESSEKILLVHPLPFEVTTTVGNHADYVHDGDLLWNTVHFYSASGFKNLLGEKTDAVMNSVNKGTL